MFLKLRHDGYYLVVSSYQRILEVVFFPSFYTCEVFFLVHTTNERQFENEFINAKHTYLTLVTKT